ncbi:beta-propeller fold lactonase family protein [Occallatibacter savannae]|uniref:beta-propeller fold lactonase family protein n=1 Tax=Occallatibacter savannae TaxID=1002691 RepID=UPI000D68D0EB|nr:beta-propeller fold lactonase family protein [Occallatibacter savannae]
MKFRKFGKALLMTALSAGAVFGVTSCVQSYSVGFLYVVGTQTASTSGAGVISGYKIDHNTGNLKPIAGLPVSSGGSNPGRSVLLSGGRFLYVLNQGSAANGAPCSATNVCSNANIVQFAIGGNGVLSSQQTFYTQGHNPFRILADASGTHLFVLDHDAPDNVGCQLVFGSGASGCGDVTVFQIDSSTGRLSYVLNSQVTAASGSPLTYFPVPGNPIDFAFSSNTVLTLSGTPATGDSVFPYAYNGASGQLSVNQNSSQPLGMHNATALQVASSVVYVLDNGVNTNGTHGQIFAYSSGSNGALQAEADGYYPDDPTMSNPNLVLAANNGKWLYVLNQGDNTNTNNAQSGIAAFIINQPYKLVPIPNGGQTAGTGAGPQCILEDPSNQFIYTANFNDSTVTGLSIDENQGNLRALSTATHAKGSYPLPGPATWCIATGRTS